VSDFVGDAAIKKLEEHRIGDVKTCEFVESRRREEDFAAMVCGWTLGARHHYDRIAAVVFVEAARRWVDAARAHARGEHSIRVIVVECLKVESVSDERWQTGN